MSRRNSHSCLCHKFINELEYNIMDGIVMTLDIDQKWKKLVAEASKNKKFNLSVDEVELIEQSHHSRPSQLVLLKLNERGMTVHDLVCLLTTLSLEKALKYFYKYVNDLLILEEQPPEFIYAGRQKTLMLVCRAAGSTPVKYQWYHDRQPLQGENRSELTISCVGHENFGEYTCRVHKRCQCNQAYVLCSYSSSCRVSNEVEAPKRHPINDMQESGVSGIGNQRLCCPDTGVIQYKAKDKIALLIGNCNYRTAPPLPAVKNDLVSFRNSLKKLDFRVFSFIDLGLEEMMNAVHSFTQMLRDGVYGVFYFAGHGFECGGESFMMPTDCKTGTSDPNECMQVSKLLATMVDRRLSLCALFLDMCRLMSAPPTECLQCGLKDIQGTAGNFIGRGAEYRPYCMRCQNPLTYNIPTTGKWTPLTKDCIINKAVFYATSSGEVAFELEDGKQGVFMKSLIKCLGSPKTMPQLYECMGQEFMKNSSGSFQRPEVEMVTLEGRTLHDENVYAKYTTEYLRGQFWDANHGILPGRKIQYADGVVVLVDFEEMLSNVLIVEAVLQTLPYGIEICNLQLKFPKELSLLPEVGYCPYENELSKKLDFQLKGDKKVFKLSEIQKLRHDLILDLRLTYSYHGEKRYESFTWNIGRPLVSYVWQNLYRKAMNP